MNKTLVVLFATLLFIMSCESRKDTSAVLTKDSIDNIDQSAADEQAHNHPHQSGGTMMSIMDKSMQDMTRLRSSGNTDVDFAATMKLHHLSAVEASQLVLEQGTDPAIKSMAQKMINDQQKEINEFDKYIASTKASGTDTTFFARSMDAMNKMNMDMDHSGSVDRQFVVMMIPHHQGAVDMSEMYLKSGRDKQLMRMATNIISSQRREIGELKAWLAKQG